MFAAAVRVLARAATIQLEEAASAHPRPPPSLLKGKQRAAPIRDLRHERAIPETDLGVVSSAPSHRKSADYSHANTLSDKQHSAGKGLQDQFATITSDLVNEPVKSPADLAGPSRPRHNTRIEESRPPSELESSVSYDPPRLEKTEQTEPSPRAPSELPRPVADERPFPKIESVTPKDLTPADSTIDVNSHRTEAAAPVVPPPSSQTTATPIADAEPTRSDEPTSSPSMSPQEEVIPRMSEAPEALVEEQEDVSIESARGRAQLMI